MCEETYQAQFMKDRFAQVATQIGHAQRKSTAWMHATAKALAIADHRRWAEKGKKLSDDHLKQLAVKMAKDSSDLESQ